ncbi:hypothetical protein B0E45_22925 [Sinorhizobium sp. A49]|nr:hypothetical protein B0E45_22925 [Sinorhizobium sp. A49]
MPQPLIIEPLGNKGFATWISGNSQLATRRHTTEEGRVVPLASIGPSAAQIIADHRLLQRPSPGRQDRVLRLEDLASDRYSYGCRQCGQHKSGTDRDR